MYKYETHCHTALISACSVFKIEDILDYYVKNGYTGIIVTDHFLRGNCQRWIKSLAYADAIKEYIKGYESLKKVARGKLDIFFAMEVTIDWCDILVYGESINDLINMPEIMNMHVEEFAKYMNDNGFLTIQAHPYRRWGRRYEDIIPVKNVLGYELYNAANTDEENAHAEPLLTKDKLPFSGSDIHEKYQTLLGGLEFENKLKDITDFVNRVKSRNYKLIVKNPAKML